MKKTLEWLVSTNLERSVPIIVSVHESEKSNYENFFKNFRGLNLEIHGHEGNGMRDAKNMLLRHIVPGDRVLSLDDDVIIHAGRKKLDGKFEDFPLYDMEGFWTECFEKIKNGGLFGIYPSTNRLFALSAPFVFRGLIEIGGPVMGIVEKNIKETSPIFGKYRINNDLERTLRFFVKYGCVFRFNHFMTKTVYLRCEGGIFDEWKGNKERMKQSQRTLIELKNDYGNLFEIVTKKTKQKCNIKLKKNIKLSKSEKIHLMLKNSIF